jgi:hypothetical protein
MLLLALYLATATLNVTAPPARPASTALKAGAGPDGGKRKGGHDDEDVR